MPLFEPFSALIAGRENLEEFVSHSLELYSEAELNALFRRSEINFPQIIAPVISGHEPLEERYSRIRKNLDDLKGKGILKPQVSAFFHYTKTNREGQRFSGLLGLVPTADYEEGKIKKHEETVQARELRFANYLQAVKFQAEPVLLTYECDQWDLDELLQTMHEKSIYSEFEKDGELHSLALITQSDEVERIQKAFEQVDAFYIADGHHRMGSTATYARLAQGDRKSQYCMALVIPQEQLVVKDFSRIVTDLGGRSPSNFLEELSQTFKLKEQTEVYYPSKKHHICMYLAGKYYRLYFRKELRGVPEGLGELDVYLLEKYVFSQLLGIEDSRLDPRVNFLKGTGDHHGIREMAKVVDAMGGVGFGFYPVDFKTLKKIADLDQRMPPKSTYIQPKLLSGLVLYDMG